MDIQFLQSRYYTKVAENNPRNIELIVLHTMEVPEGKNTATQVAKYFQTAMIVNGAPRIASFHYAVDSSVVVQCVLDKDVAFCAPGTNHNGLHIEHAGYASQGNAQWSDEYSTKELALSAQLVASLCNEYWLPVEFVDAEALLLGSTMLGSNGITTHAEVSKACLLAQKRQLKDSVFFNKKSNKPLTDHTDPGPNFPMDMYLQMVRERM